MHHYRVIFHLNEREKAQMVLSNIENLLNDLGENNVEVELLANAGGLEILTKNFIIHDQQISLLASRNVQFRACSNTMRHLGLNPEDLLPVVKIVPAGVSELVRKQAEGWAYIKP